MFEEQEQNKNNGVEDILAATEAPGAGQNAGPLGPPSALAQGKLQPVQPGAGSPVVPLDQLSHSGQRSWPVKKIIALVILVLVVGGVATAGYWWWSGRAVEEATPAIPLGQPGNEPVNNSINQVLNEFQQNSINKALEPLAPPENPSPDIIKQPAAVAPPSADTDQDGLNDADELTNGTNPRLVDTDGDGLSDWEEVSVFGTNPLQGDTDGDSYPDGAEVQNGYNPKGAGKLLDFEKAKAQAQ